VTSCGRGRHHIARQASIVIVGAGPTGIGAAHRAQELGLDWILFESASVAGGMAASVTDDHGFTWDLGGHVLHSHFDSFDKAIANSGIELTYPVRNGWVQTGGQLKRTPVQQHLDEIPTDLRPDAPAPDLAAYFTNHFGKKLADEFFIPFQYKMWATPVDGVDHAWTSLRNGSAERNVPQIGQAPSSAPVAFPYPRGGTGRLWDAVAATLPQERIHYNTAVTAINTEANTVTLSSGAVISYQQILLTMLGMPAAEELCANEVLIIGMGFTGDAPAVLADKSWLYNPDLDVAWHRATMLSNYDPDNAGPGRWSILFEIGRSAQRPVTDDDALASCLASLTGFGADTSELVSTWTRTLPMGYPVPTLGRDPLLRQHDARLTAVNIRSRGRFGGWRYESCNQDYSFAQGVEAVEAITTDAPENALWHAEMF
jgi:protoporphyrinogen oxidase